MSRILCSTLYSSEETSDSIEWDEVDKMSTIWFHFFYYTDGRYISTESLWKMLQWATPLPPNSIRMSLRLIWKYSLRGIERLPQLAHSMSFANWRKYLEKPDSGTSHFVLGLMLNDQSHYNKGLSWLRARWLPFLDDADEALASMALSWGISLRYDKGFPCDTSNLIACCKKLASLCDRSAWQWFVFLTQKLIFLIRNSKNEYSKQRALVCIAFVLGHDYYSRSYMLEALSGTMFYRSPAYSSLGPTPLRKTMLGFYIYRHTNAKGQLIHLISPRNRIGLEQQDCKDCTVESKWVYSTCNILVMAAASTIPRDVVPICAGILSNGIKAYITTHPLGLFTFQGDRGETSLLGSEQVDIPILRFVPDSYPRIPNSYQLEAASRVCLDPAELGYGWQFGRYVSRIDEGDLSGGCNETWIAFDLSTDDILAVYTYVHVVHVLLEYGIHIFHQLNAYMQ